VKDLEVGVVEGEGMAVTVTVEVEAMVETEMEAEEATEVIGWRSRRLRW